MYAASISANISECDAGLAMKQGLSLRVSQHLALTPQLQQSIRLLQLSTLELSQEIEQMLDENPFLDKDFEEAPREEFGIDSADTPVRDDDISIEAETESLREMPKLDGGMSEISVDNTASDTEPSVDGIAESWEGDGSVDFSPDDSEWGGDAPASKNNNASDEVADATELARSQESLTAHLHRQALGLRLSETDRAALRFLIENLNDDGYLEDSLRSLAEGLAVNPTLKMLSVTYCGIDVIGAQGIFEILIYTKTALEEINLSGNLLRNDGVIKVLTGVSIAKALKKCILADNQFSCDDEDVMKTIGVCMEKNKTLGKYDFKYNIVTTACK